MIHHELANVLHCSLAIFISLKVSGQQLYSHLCVFIGWHFRGEFKYPPSPLGKPPPPPLHTVCVGFENCAQLPQVVEVSVRHVHHVGVRIALHATHCFAAQHACMHAYVCSATSGCLATGTLLLPLLLILLETCSKTDLKAALVILQLPLTGFHALLVPI